jgi:hypothetical protein
LYEGLTEEVQDVSSLVGNQLHEYFTLVFYVYKDLLITLNRLRKNGRIKASVGNELDSIILKGVLDYKNNYSLTRMYSDINALKSKYAITEFNFKGVMQAAPQIISYIGAISTALITIFVSIKTLKDFFRGLGREAKSKSIFTNLFEGVIIPRLKKIYFDMKDGKIQSVNELKFSFYNMIKEISSYYPEVGDILTQWSPK